jgi:hypothetical protein
MSLEVSLGLLRELSPEGSLEEMTEEPQEE